MVAVTEASKNLRLRGDIIDGLRKNLIHGGHSLSAIPESISLLIEKDMWREWVEPQTGRVVRFERFEDFVTTPPLEGLGSSVRQLKHLCKDDTAALDAIDLVTVGGLGRPHKSSAETSTNRECFDRGETVQNALHSLRDKRPDLHAEVLAKKKKLHTAMLEAGLRRKRISIYVDDPAAAARAIGRNASPDYVRQLREELLEEC